MKSWAITSPTSLVWAKISTPNSSMIAMIFTAKESHGLFGTCMGALNLGKESPSTFSSSASNRTLIVNASLERSVPVHGAESIQSMYVLAKDGATGKPHKIGTTRNFRYENGRYTDQNGAWLMAEYEMAEEDALVLCALRKNSRKAPQSYPDQRDITTEKKSANDKKRKRHQPGKQNKKKKEEETYEIAQDLQPKKLKKEETYEEKDSSSCTQGLPYHHDQNK
ncbi:hypothetical protein M0R45_028382 [Rubus argutus]|uniref:NAC domain-containing protein n=1 Tax=Rubus argutus TaxID=59490 RepID=A0AAW1W4G3_RUBAR